MDEAKLKELEVLLKLRQHSHPERLFVAELIREEDKVIYDLGCGGHKTLKRAIGVDIRRVTDIRASIDDMPMIASNSADIIISRHSLEHLIDPVKALVEWRRILTINGKMIVVLPDHEFVDTMDFRISSGVHLHAYTRQSFANLVLSLGQCVVTDTTTVIKGWSFGAIVERRD